MRQIKFIFLLLLLGSSHSVLAQDDSETDMPPEDLPVRKSFYISLEAGVYKPWGVQGYYYSGNNDYSLLDLLSNQNVKNDIYNKTGKNTTLYEAPGEMRFNFGIYAGINLMYFVNENMSFAGRSSFSKLVTKGAFSLSATDPNNQFGEPVILIEGITGTERRSNIDLGIRFEDLYLAGFNPYFETGVNVLNQKAVKNEVLIEGLRYNLLAYDPLFSQPQRALTTYGAFLGFGVTTSLNKRYKADIGCLNYIQHLKTPGNPKVSFSTLLHFRIWI
jgi:hypothetical protein